MTSIRSLYNPCNSGWYYIELPPLHLKIRGIQFRKKTKGLFSPPYFQFNSVQFSSVQFNSIQFWTILLLSHITIHFSSIQFNSIWTILLLSHITIHFSSIQFTSVQLFYAEENRPKEIRNCSFFIRFLNWVFMRQNIENNYYYSIVKQTKKRKFISKFTSILWVRKIEILTIFFKNTLMNKYK